MESVAGLEVTPALTELWLNMNKISDPKQTLITLSHLKCLQTIYLADNEVVQKLKEINPEYHAFLKECVPSLEQIDGYMLKQLFRMNVGPATGVTGITKKEINPKAQEILKEVIMKFP